MAVKKVRKAARPGRKVSTTQTKGKANFAAPGNPYQKAAAQKVGRPS
jgi:hypothetical protein